jgi:murein DD-endopeptidase MepM/ murein hydrolase activator NlpD
MKDAPVMERAFAPRQIIVSTDGQPKYFTLSRAAQYSVAAAGFATVVLIAGMSWHIATQKTELDQQQYQLSHLQEKVRSVSSNLLHTRASLRLTKSELDQQYTRLEGILSQRQNLEQTLKVATANLQKKTTDLSSRDQYARDLEGRINMLTSRLQHTNEQSEDLSLRITKINKTLFQTTEERDLYAEGKLIAQKKLSSLKRELQIFQSTKDEIYKELQDTKNRLGSVESDRREGESAVSNLEAQVSGLKSRISKISKENKSLISRVHAQAEQGIDVLKETITLTGLNPEKILAPDNIVGIGGPFQSLSNSSDLLAIEQLYYEDAQRMEASLAKWTTLNKIMKNIPLARPTDRGYISSSFGSRRDPVTKKRAFHSGTDISGPKNSAILATAPGKVIAAGRSGPYGLMVEIDHGQGFRTKYGHMKRITVKRGQMVDFRTKIGVMGSTGRSTGRHVHYEIWHNGKAQDAAKFFKAGNYAFKTDSVTANN